MKYYLTVPIYYVNAAPHIGHFYTTMAADLIKRMKTMQGYDVVLTTGSDEHGQNVERAARKIGKTPEDYATVISEEFRQQWISSGLGVDRFMRTSDPRHHQTVRWLFDRCRQNGYIYKGTYTGQYCFNCELYVNEAGPGDPCPDCKRPTETITEDNYFFKLSAFQDKLLELYESQPGFIQPEIRRNEVLAFARKGLNDLSITRTSIKWGIPVPVEGSHVFYVWFDALITYMSAVEGEDRWPADLHLIGKEIVRFHAVYWPAFLMAAGLPLPKRVFAHGWLLFENDKMSKSRGNIVRATPIQKVMGADALRYFLLREVVFGQDGSFSYDALVGRYNSDLANGLGNLVSRTLTMIRQYRGGVIPPGPADAAVAAASEAAIAATLEAFENFEFSKGLDAVWSLISAADRFIVESAPWKLAKQTGDEEQAQLSRILYTAADVVRVVTALLTPVLPESSARIWEQLGIVSPPVLNGLAPGQLAPGQPIGTIQPIFPRADAATAIDAMRAGEAEELARQQALLGQAPPKADLPPPAPLEPPIAIDDFLKVDMRVGQVLSAEPVKGADKLLHLKIDIGEPQPRTIVAGIALAYKPEQVVGRKVAIVANLAPRKLRGIESQGMIIAASLEGGSPALVSFLEEAPVGARLK
ncbi:MAG: methionine--tRNA ligase [Acidobacteria bacterium]|nr:methionine--tRNA ligase [Acidobacteriota bacterium]